MGSANKFRQHSDGFTLVELMVVVAIIGLLAAIATPIYSGYVVRANRVDAQDKLTEVMFEQERFQLRRRSYTTDLTDLGYAAAANIASTEGHYTIAAAACGGNIRNCVVLTATPAAGGAQARANEPALTLNSRGEQTGPWRR